MEDQARAEWRKSTFSTTNGCVEVAVVGDAARNVEEHLLHVFSPEALELSE